MPVAWQRYWRSGNPGDGVLGRGWNPFWRAAFRSRIRIGLRGAPSGDFVAFPGCRAATNLLRRPKMLADAQRRRQLAAV
nr:DUF6531 domain-containing protein [Serratia marcescens]